jgi:hypothetical protein
MNYSTVYKVSPIHYIYNLHKSFESHESHESQFSQFQGEAAARGDEYLQKITSFLPQNTKKAQKNALKFKKGKKKWVADVQ